MAYWHYRAIELVIGTVIGISITYLVIIPIVKCVFDIE